MAKMIGEQRIEIIRDRLLKAFSPLYLEVIDESDQHLGHKGYQGGGRHFAIIIAAECFRGVSRIDTHRQIYKILSDMIPNEIHALRIKLR